ncbi:MAG: hypothetical protein MJ189_02110 [Coriobacteriales bacterium]|nr:hypothetical protein [Coriobacteriales bacterium]
MHAKYLKTLFKSSSNKSTIVDLLFVFFAFCIAFLISPLSAFAYVDPSVMTYTIQAIASVAVVLASVMGVAWRRFKKALTESLEIDLNKRKLFEIEVEEKDCDPLGQPKIISSQELKELKKGKLDEETKESRKERLRLKFQLSFKLRFIASFIVMLFFTLSIAFFSPLSLVSSQQNQFIIKSLDLILPLLFVAIILALIFALILALIKGRAFFIVASIILGVAIACVVQRLCLNFELPPLDGRALNLNDFQFQVILSIIIWLLIVAILLLVANKKPKFSIMLGGLFVSVLLLIQIFSLAFAIPGAIEDANKQEITCTEDGMLDVSSQKNVVVLVFDHYQYKLFEKVYKQNPSILEGFDDFDIYSNATCFYEYTRFASPFVLNSVKPGMQSSRDELRNKGSKYSYDLKKAGFNVGLYTMDFYGGKPNLQPYTINLKSERFSYNLLGELPYFVKLGLYRDMPWILKPIFNTDIDSTVNQVETNNSKDKDSLPYNGRDDITYHKLMNHEMKINDRDSKGSYRYYHFTGTHQPTEFKEDFTIDPDNATEVSEALSCMNMARAYFNELKRLNVYDNTMIIMTADHGEGLCNNYLVAPCTPIFFVKQFNTTKEHRPAKFVELPTGHHDMHISIIDAVGADTSSYSGHILKNLTLNTEPRYFYKTHNKYECYLEEHDDYMMEYVNYDGKDCQVYENWEKTGKTYPIIMPY